MGKRQGSNVTPEDREVLERIRRGEPLPVDDHVQSRLEALLLEGIASGGVAEMTPQDWVDIRREAMALLKTRKSA